MFCLIVSAYLFYHENIETSLMSVKVLNLMHSIMNQSIFLKETSNKLTFYIKKKILKLSKR